MNKETQLIMESLKGLDGPDVVIDKLAKKNSRQKLDKNKRVKDWESTDFLKYIGGIAYSYGITFDVSLARDSGTVNQIYDKMALHIKQDMSNAVLKDYIDWWLSSYGKYTQEGRFTIMQMTYDKYTNKFIKWYSASLEKTKNNIIQSDKTNQTDKPKMSPATIYEFGGLQMLLLTCGVVTSYWMVKGKKPKPEMEILNVLKEFSPKAVNKVLKITLTQGPYKNAEKIDFVSILSPLRESHSLRDFDTLDYKKYFA